MTTKPSTKPFDLFEEIAINPEAIVSRTITKSDAFNLTLFAFDEEQSLSGHSSPMDAWVQILSGEMEITVGDEAFSIIPGVLLLMPAGVPHALVATKPSRMLLTMVKHPT